MSKVTKLEDVNEDCLLLIFEHLPVADLLSMENINSHFNILAADELKRRFSRKLVVIEDFAMEMSVNPLLGKMYESRDCIYLFNAPLIVRFLKQFGSSIESLQINFDTMGLILDPPNSQVLFQLIAEHCSKSLSQLHLGWLKQSIFNNMKTVFEKVEIISFEGRLYDLGLDEFSLNDLFPALRELYLNEVVLLRDPDCLKLKIPHLVHLEVTIDEGDAAQLFVTQRLISELIRKNPQIQSLVMRQASANLLKSASVKLIQLKHLEIYDYRGRNNDNRNIHFEHVKSFKVDNDVPVDISFGNDLKDFEIEGAIPDNNKYIEFIENNKHLKRIQIKGRYGLTNDEIFRLATIQSNAESLSVVCDQEVEHENINKLIRNFRNSKQFHLKLIAGPFELDDLAAMLEEQFERDFFVKTVFENFEVILEQKPGN